MSKQSANVKWTSGMAFKANANGHEIMLDADEHVGGENLGPRPKVLLLASLGGCTGMDVIAILKKMKVEVDYFNMVVDGDVTDDHPKQFTSIHITYEFRGKDLAMEKIEKAVTLSQDKYCGVSATLKKAIPVTWEIKILDQIPT
jgi:putative redox protein